jgi:hypothetical protein
MAARDEERMKLDMMLGFLHGRMAGERYGGRVPRVQA